MIKLFTPYVSWSAVWNVIRVLRSGYIAEGEQVKKFEQEFGEKFHKQNVVAVNSGTSALELAYELAGIGKGDEVISPVLTCSATNIPIVRRGAKVVFADISPNTLNIDVADARKRITKKTKAIVFVHFLGNNDGLYDILELGKECGIKVIEDAAQAVGSSNWGYADFTAVSLQAIKTLTSGDGGFLICKRRDDYLKAKRLRWFGYDRELKQIVGDHDLKEAGYKYHMNDISAAIGRGNLKHIDKIIKHRKALRRIYWRNEIISGIWSAGVVSNKRAELKRKLRSMGIETGLHHYRNDKYTIFGGRKKLKNMDYLEDKYLILPLHHKMSGKDALKISRVCQDLK